MEHNKSQKGFTLVELSIVLVIIGLIVGGVLVGQDLINAAKIRAHVSQLEKFDAGASTFRAKYNFRAGDGVRGQVDAFFGANVLVPGNGDGTIDDGVAGNTNTFDAEIENYWQYLTVAALIPGVPIGTLNPAVMPNSCTDCTLPESSLGRGFITLGSKDNDPTSAVSGSLLYYFTTDENADNANINTVLTPAEAFGVDSKLDDGRPNTGIIRAYGGDGMAGSDVASPQAALFGSATGCTTDADDTVDANLAEDEYALANEDTTCNFAYRAQGG